MAYKIENGMCTITCDKCAATDIATEKNAGDVFFDLGWGTYPNAKKYVQVCRNCQPAKHRKSHDFVKNKFGL